MKTGIRQILVLLSISVLVVLSACTGKKKEAVKVDQGFKEYISAFSSGIISSKDVIRVKLTSAYAQEFSSGNEVSQKVFSFEPAIKGSTHWVDSRTLEFRPDEALPSGMQYTGKLALHKLIDIKKDKFKTFPLQFQVIKQNIQIRKGELKPYNSANLKEYKYNGTLVTADVMENDAVENLLLAEQDGKALEISWIHNARNNTHRFQVDHIQRKQADDMFLLAWDGSKYNMDVAGSQEIDIPGQNNFKLISAQVFHQPAQYVLFTFSDPLQSDQNLNGLIRIHDEKGLKFSIIDNQVKAYLQTRISGERKVSVDKAIKNTLGFKLKSSKNQKLTFEATKPDVRLIGEGVILPNSNGLMFPFEAVNLSAVDVKVIKIYEDNIAQFLQVNNLSGERDLRRVGRLITKQKINLVSENIIDYGRWNAFSIDLSRLIATEPGAIYKVELSFQKSYSLYPCADSEEEADDLAFDDWDENNEEEQSYWDSAEDYYYYDEGGYYSWYERDNPCDASYYKYKKVSRNVLASDIGLIAKIGKNKRLEVAVTDLRTTEPISGVSLEALNYQQQPVGAAQTNDQGIASLPLDGKPFLLIAKSGEQRGYLKLNDGASLSLSKFDVSGESFEKGIKGYLYGERGVWRPGDTIYLTFILEDKDLLLPPDHPVSFELINPLGKVVQRTIRMDHENNFYNFTTNTLPDDPTGYWTARVKVGGATFTRYLSIETIKPNRLKIKLDFNKEVITKGENTLKGTLAVKWLHGALAKNLDAEIKLSLTAIKTKFKTFNDYVFDDPSVNFSAIEKTIFQGAVNAQGTATVTPSIDISEKAPGMLQARFNTKVFEEGGNFSVDQFSMPYAPYKSYVGIKVPKGDKARGMLLTDEKHTIEVVTVNAQGEKVSQKGLIGKVYKVEWRWWWQAGSDNIGNYIQRNHVKPILTEEFSTTDGLGSFEIEVKYPDWGRYLIQVISPEGHSTGKTVYIDWPGWAGRAQDENGGGASMLNFSTNQSTYKVGENIEVSMPSSKGGRALVSIEKGSRVVEMHWVETQKDQTKFSFKATEEMAPNVYINVSMLQPHGQTANDLPIRLYGVVPVLVENPETRLEPVIEMPNELKPEETVRIRVSEKNGKDMTFTLAVVDEGLLDLTRFQTPNPWDKFYAREALSVKTWDLYDMVMGAYGAKIEAEFAIGGGGDADNNKAQKARRFKPVVVFFGPYTLSRGKKEEISFTMPRYIGSVRTMVIAGDKGAYGSAEKTTPVKNPLMLMATLPRVLSPGEKVKLPVTLFAMNNKMKQVKVEIKTNDLMQVNGSKSQTIDFSQPGEQDFTFDVTAGQKLGIARVELIAKSGQEQASYEIELDIRAPHPKRTTTQSAVLQAGESWEQNFELFGLMGTNAAKLEVSGMPPINLEQRLKYLIRYPYGCIEQTTSSVFPQLYLGEVMALDKELKKETKANIVAALGRLISFQLTNGGFTYWPGNTEADEWGTNYAGHFMLEAEASGYDLPVGMRSSWLLYQKEKTNNWSPQTNRHGNNGFTQAYRLYTLALAGETDLGAMNRLKEYEELGVQGRYYLSMAYVYAGNEAAAQEILANIPREVESGSIYSNTYGSEDRDRAIILEGLLSMEMYDEAMPLIQTLSDHLNSKKWMSTQTTAYCLRAMAKAAGIFKESVDEFKYSVALNNKKELDVMSTTLVSQTPLAITQNKMDNHLKVTNKSKAPFYINLTTEGIPLKDETIAEAKNIQLSVRYYDLDGQRINEAAIVQGTDFKAEFTVSHLGLMDDIENLALETMFPSGWEIVNTRLYGGGETHMRDKPDYQDMRDDRVYTFFDLKKNGSQTFVVLLNASYLGSYEMPAMQCSAMYDNNIRARIPGKTVKVIKPGE